MLARKLKEEAVARPPLEDRIAELRRDIEAFIEARIDELATPGLPRGVIRQTILGNLHCSCAGALKILADKQRDFEIAARQS